MLRSAATLAVENLYRSGSTPLGTPYQLEIRARFPLEIRRRIITFNDEGHIELFIETYHIRSLDLDARLRAKHRGHNDGNGKERQYGGGLADSSVYERSFEHLLYQFFSFCLDLRTSAFSLFTLSCVSFSFA